MAARLRNRRHPAPPPDPRIDELNAIKQLYTDYCAEIRRGYGNGYDASRRVDIIRNIVLPKHGRWRGMQDPYTANARQPRVVRARAIFGNSISQSPERLQGKRRQKMQNAYSATFRLNQNFTPAHVTFRKILGMGGFGVAALFGLHDSRGREVTVVVKADLRPRAGNPMSTEKKRMVLMSGAKHVVQRTLLARFPWPRDTPAGYDYFGALQRVTIKLFIFLAKVISLLLLTILQILLFFVGITVQSMWEERVAEGNADRDPANNPNPRPAAAPPADAEPDPAEPIHPLLKLIPSLQSWKMSKLWPDWPAEPPRGPRTLGIDGIIRLNRQRLDAREDIICMEFLKFGDLGKWIGKMTRQNNDEPESIFSEKVAWTIFECLWRGCVALAYPAGFYQGKDPLTTQIPPITESSEKSAVDGGDPMVHFDLDPQNMFVGDFAPDHGLWPLTKVGDLGLSLQTKSQVFKDDIDEMSTKYTQRGRGKRDSLLPEQTTEQWDYIASLDELRNHEVVANYGAHSNIYHIGLTMFELMTLNFPDDPPIARPYDFVIDREHLSGWTYGHNLLEENYPELARQYSAELRHTVAWCMEHNPMDRPSLDRLGQIVEPNAAAYSPQDQRDDASREMVGNLLGTPLPPRAL